MRTHGTSINDQGDMSDGRYQNISFCKIYIIWNCVIMYHVHLYIIRCHSTPKQGSKSNHYQMDISHHGAVHT